MYVEAIRALNDKIESQNQKITDLEKLSQILVEENEVLKAQAAKINELEDEKVR